MWHRAVLIIFPVNLQTITITWMLSDGGEGRERCKLPQQNWIWCILALKSYNLVATTLIIFMRNGWLNFTKIAPVNLRIPCALVQRMSANEKLGGTKHRASPPLQTNGGNAPCPPTDLRPWVCRPGSNMSQKYLPLRFKQQTIMSTETYNIHKQQPNRMSHVGI